MSTTEDPKDYARSIAADIFTMLRTAGEQGLNLDQGFHNEPLSTRQFALRYLFFSKSQLLRIPGTPPALKGRLRRANVLAAVMVQGRMTGLHLLCAFAKPFAAVASQDEVLAAIDQRALDAYTEQVRALLADDLDRAVNQAGPGPDAVN